MTPPAKQGDKYKASELGDQRNETSEGTFKDIQRGRHQPDREVNEGRQVKTDIQKAGHHQPDRETNQLEDEPERERHHHLEKGGHLERERERAENPSSQVFSGKQAMGHH